MEAVATFDKTKTYHIRFVGGSANTHSTVALPADRVDVPRRSASGVLLGFDRYDLVEFWDEQTGKLWKLEYHHKP